MDRRDFLKTISAAGLAANLGGCTMIDGEPQVNLASGKSTQRPNILWLMTDEHRTDSLGCYGSTWAKTPNLDRLAREGVVFRHAVTPAPVCGPARAALTTGRYPSELGIWWNLPTPWPVNEHLTEPLHAAGYRTAAFGRHHIIASNPMAQTQVTRFTSRHVDAFKYAPEYDESKYDVIKYPGEPYPWIFGGRFPAPAEETAEAVIIGEAKEWLATHPAEAPFFLHVSFNAPHTPVSVPEPFDKIIDPESIKLPPEAEVASPGEPAWIRDDLRRAGDPRLLSADQIKQMRGYYYGLVSFTDHLFGDLLDWMRTRGLLENTIVVFVADHGTHLGDYCTLQKQTFYEPSVCVPYFYWYPAAFARGVTIENPVETRGLMATVLDAAGVEAPEWCRADSLAECLRTGKEPPVRPVFSELTLESFAEMNYDSYRLVMVREGDWKLSMRMDPEPGDGALFNLAEDPYERENRYERPECGEIRARLEALIADHIEGAPRRLG